MVSDWHDGKIHAVTASDVFGTRQAVAENFYNNRRAILSTFFKFVLQQEWITGTPVEKDALSPDQTSARLSDNDCG